MPDIAELFTRATEPLRARTVYAEPVENGGVTVIAAARVFGGGGGGDGVDRHGQQVNGGGLGLFARPVGAFVIKDGEVWWEPAVDVNRLAATIGTVAVAGLFLAVRFLRPKAGTGG